VQDGSGKHDVLSAASGTTAPDHAGRPPIEPVVPPKLDGPKPKDRWDKTDIVGKLLGSILIPIGLAIAGYFVNGALQDRASKQKTAEIAITILQSKEATSPALRNWAASTFSQMLLGAGRPLSAEALKELQTSPLPAPSDSNLPVTCPFDASRLSGRELAARFEGERIDEQKFSTLEKSIRGQPGVSLTDRQAQALTALAYNIGLRQVIASSIFNSIRAGDLASAGEQFLRWDRAGGRLLAGLHARRLCERDLFMSQ
jgi:hypothetical protein